MALPEPPFGSHPGVSDITMALNYQCNSRCTFCFLEPELDMKLPTTDRDYLERVFAHNQASGSFERIIFSGAEATLRPDLAEIVAGARERGGFQHVRIQDQRAPAARQGAAPVPRRRGARRVLRLDPRADRRARCRPDPRPRSFDEMRAGIANILEAGARLISNTCVTSRNVDVLPDLARFLLGEGVPESQLWSFVEFGDIGQTDSHVPFSRSIPKVREAARILKDGGNRVSLSWWPACMLGEEVALLENHRAFTVIDSTFARRMHAAADFRCAFADSCAALRRPLHRRPRALPGDVRRRAGPAEAHGRQAVSLADRYTTRGWMEAEQRDLWPRVWWLAGLALDLPSPGSRFVASCGRESVLVVRGDDGRVRAFHNVCPHRGHPLCEGRGSGRAITCPYHHWTFALDGGLTKRDDPDGFPHGDVRLAEVQCTVFAGLVWVCLDSDAGSLSAWLGPVADRLAAYQLEDLALESDTTMPLACNWKASVDVHNEGYHVHTIHPQVLGLIDDTGVQVDPFGPHARMIVPMGRPSARKGEPAIDRALEGRLRQARHRSGLGDRRHRPRRDHRGRARPRARARPRRRDSGSTTTCSTSSRTCS